ncbi:MAG: TusE/DsrC/DsvC family sulfur relay protein [Pseudomonadales bacterium]|nr:TusE/DsrC/DsvC family sulfur relay protein [Pseudomonadales bacterium]NIX08883.1 TusE/DsrC/DsvC family sulfur relay protein [Pseudomonadales bacterium]
MQEVRFETDREGYLVDLADWSEAVAEQLAASEGISLTDEHWALIKMIRAFYETFEVSPAMRVLVKHTREQLGEKKGNSIYLLKLFPGSPAKLLAKIAGLPRPTNCL